MKTYSTNQIRNIALLGCSKAGKTTLSESLMFAGGQITRIGSVEAKNTISDFHEIEHDRGNSVCSSLVFAEYNGNKINIIDTPGLDDFVGELVPALRVADTYLMVLNAQSGVEVGTELVWNYASRYGKPMILVVNQLNHSNAKFETSTETAQKTFGSAVALVQFPVNPGEGFNQVVDVLKMKMYEYSGDGKDPVEKDIPAEHLDKAEELRNELIEKAAESDEALMEIFFEKGTLDEDEILKGLKQGFTNGELYPLFCSCAPQNIGSDQILNFICNVAPAPDETVSEKDENDEDVAIDSSKPAVAFVFKTMIEPHLGQLSFFKVVNGELSNSMDLVNHNNDNTERINQLFVMGGKNRNPVDSLVAGDLGATLKLKTTRTNETLKAKAVKLGVKPIDFPKPRIRMVIISQDKSTEEKLSEALADIQKEDQTIKIEYSRELKQLLISAQGELQLNIIKWKLEHISKLNIEYGSPRIPYRETIQKPASSSYRHKKQSGGAGQFGEVYMKIEPYYEGMPEPTEFSVRGKDEIELPWGGKLIFYNCIVGGVIDLKYIPAIQKGIMEKMNEGPLTGSYARDVRVMVYDGKMHPVDSNDISFKIAGKMAFRDAFVQADPKILEPVHELEVRVPEELMGDVMTDLQTRRSIIMGMDANGNYQLIKAKTPLAELDRYSTSLRSITQGRASFSGAFSEYSPVPHDVQEKLIAQYAGEDEE